MAMPLLSLISDRSPAPAAGATLVSTEGLDLPLRHTSVRVEARGGVARVVVEQCFANPHHRPLSVSYRLPLPADAAVSGYAFQLGSRRIVGEVDRKQQARERFEQALLEGRTAALLEQERSSVFTQELGNIPPGAELVAEISLDQPLIWLSEGCWEWRFPTVVAPRYLGAEGRVADAPRLAIQVSSGPMKPRASLDLRIGDELSVNGQPRSNTHPLALAEGGALVSLADEGGARLDRDIAIRWPVARPAVGVALQLARGAGPRGAHAHGLLTLVPPQVESRPAPVARDLVVLIDTSGSMGGRPLDQARRVVSALIESLDEQDQLELIEFSSAPRRWKAGATRVTSAARRDALAWVRKLSAGGGTEMRTALLEAFAPLRPGAQRQVVLVTDGLIGFEDEILAAIHDRMPPSSRLHCVGVGSAVNRSLSRPASRAGRGVELIVDLDEDAEPAARRLVAHTAAPLVTDLRSEGPALVDTAPARLPDLFAGTPALISLRLDPRGGVLTVRGTTADGEWSSRVEVPASGEATGPAHLATLYAREQVEDLEARWALGRDRSAVDARIEQLGLDYQISTRLTSWVAITSEITVERPSQGLHQEMPQEIPYGASIEGLGLRAPAEALAALSIESAKSLRAAVGPVGPDGASAYDGSYPLAAPAPQAAPASFARPAPMSPGVSSSFRDVSGGIAGNMVAPAAAPRSRQGFSWVILLVLLVLVALPVLLWWWLRPARPLSPPPAASTSARPLVAPEGPGKP
jgi:Ca-activated chloride channel family protein